MKLYMQVTNDQYELPLIVAGSAAELGRMVGKSSSNILSTILHAKQRGARCQFVAVDLEEEFT